MSQFEIIVIASVVALGVLLCIFLCSVFTVAGKITQVAELLTRIILQFDSKIQDLQERVHNLEAKQHQTDELE